MVASVRASELGLLLSFAGRNAVDIAALGSFRSAGRR
jgi:hypothetical protein